MSPEDKARQLQIDKADQFLEDKKYDMPDEQYNAGKARIAQERKALYSSANKAITPSDAGKLGKYNPLEEIARIRVDKPESLLSSAKNLTPIDEFTSRQAAEAAQREGKMAAKIAANAPAKVAQLAEMRAATEMARKAAQEGGESMISRLGKGMASAAPMIEKGLAQLGSTEGRMAALQGLKRGGMKMLGTVAGPAVGIASALQSGDVSAMVPGMESEALGLERGMEGYDIENPSRIPQELKDKIAAPAPIKMDANPESESPELDARKALLEKLKLSK